VASEQTAESTVSVFALPSEDMKGRIIGREGRNIRAFETVTGVNLIIDDTPEAVVLSCFDPVRREAARITLANLVEDGRIHPARIEEIHERSLRELEEQVRRAGEDAVAEVGITDIHPEMVKLLGRLRYRTSYGQNVLRHLVESAHIASSLAAEIGVEPTIVKRGAFLHDIGKAVTHEVEGSHAIIGAEIARRMGESPEVVHCIESHHGEVEQHTIDAVLAQIADGISGGRPGARRESLETYVKRLERLEEICTAHPGVVKTFAMQAGREVRVMVEPGDVDDMEAQVIARDIAKQVEDELQYPGQIRITVVRETRAVEFARGPGPGDRQAHRRTARRQRRAGQRPGPRHDRDLVAAGGISPPPTAFGRPLEGALPADRRSRIRGSRSMLAVCAPSALPLGDTRADGAAAISRPAPWPSPAPRARRCRCSGRPRRSGPSAPGRPQIRRAAGRPARRSARYS
jgi:putative nucleotidyltransferase with HDIG domain